MSIDPQRMKSADEIVRFKARRLCRRRGFNRSDRPDVEQELWLHLIVQSAKFDPAVTTWEKYVSYILDKRCISLMRHRTAAKRTPGREECSLNDSVLDADGRIVERHQTTPEATSTWQRLHDLERDIGELHENLQSAKLQAVHDLLGRGGTVNSIHLDLGLSRPAVERLIDELRELYRDADLREYL